MSLTLYGHNFEGLNIAGKRRQRAGLVISKCFLSLLEAQLIFIKQLQLKPGLEARFKEQLHCHYIPLTPPREQGI